MRARRITGCALLAALAGSGCLTTPASETGWSRRMRDAVPRACGPDAIIEDGEDGDNRALVRPDGRGGYWFTSVDPEGSTIEPSGTFKMSSPGHDGSKFAAHMHGVMASAGPSVYASMGFSLADPRGPYDASQYAGVSFWAKGPAHVRFEIPDAYTDPSGGICKDCYNDFGVELAFTAEWQRYTIPFEWLAQRGGWGEPRPRLTTKELIALEWQFGSFGREYDVWVDDITFICGVEGTESAP
jgi:endoglucanase